MKTVKILLVAAIVAAVIIGVAVAQQGGGGGGAAGGGGTRTGGGMGGMRMGRMGGSPTRMVVMMREQLELTDDQVTKLEAIRPDDPNAMTKAQQELAEVQTAVTVAAIAGDEAKIKEACKKIGPAQEKIALLQAKDYKQIKGILTAEQYKSLQEMMTRPMTMGGRTGAPGQGPGTGAGPGGTRPGGQQ